MSIDFKTIVPDGTRASSPFGDRKAPVVGASKDHKGVDIAAPLGSSVVNQADGKVVPLLGAVSWLLMQQNATRHTLLSELEWRVMPALVLDQAKLYMRDGAPLAYVSWARLSDAVAQRYMAPPHQLMAADWQSGPHIWIVDLCAPFGGVQEVMQDLRATVFAGQEVHQLQMDAGGRIKPMIWPTGA